MGMYLKHLVCEYRHIECQNINQNSRGNMNVKISFSQKLQLNIELVESSSAFINLKLNTSYSSSPWMLKVEFSNKCIHQIRKWCPNVYVLL